MKLFKIAAIALSLSVSAGAFASAPAADCSAVKNDVKPVCESYNVLQYAVKAYYKDLKADKRELDATREYWTGCRSLYKAVSSGEGKATIEKRLQKVYEKDNAVISQVSFLARFIDKYKTHKGNILWDKQIFEDAVNDYLSNADDQDDFDDDNESDDTDDSSDSDDADDFDDDNEADDK